MGCCCAVAVSHQTSEQMKINSRSNRLHRVMELHWHEFDSQPELQDHVLMFMVLAALATSVWQHHFVGLCGSSKKITFTLFKR